MPTDKEIALAKKEGGKKGQDLVGMNEMGGIKHFHVALENCEGSWELLQAAIDGANAPVEEGAEERKGGAGDLGKMFFTTNNDRLIFQAHLPPAAADKFTLKEWVDEIAKSIGAEVTDVTETSAKGEIKADPNNDKFPLKLRDQAIGAGFAFLRARGLVMDDDDEEIDYGLLAEQAGVEW